MTMITTPVPTTRPPRDPRLLCAAALAAILALTLPAQTVAQPIVQAPAPRLNFSADEMALARGVARDPGLASYYGATGLRPLFTAPDAGPRRAALVAAVAQAPLHGLPEVYDLAGLRALQQAPHGPQAEIAFARSFARWTRDVGGGILNPRQVQPAIKREVVRRPTAVLLREFAEAPDPAAVLAAVPPQDAGYRALQAALSAETGPTLSPDVPRVPEGTFSNGTSGPGVLALRARLAALGFAADSSTSDSFDAPLAEAVAQYQRRVGLRPDGVAGPRTVARLNRGPGQADKRLLVALERMRWLNGHDLTARMVWVNLPEYNARVMEGGRTVFQTRVVIGKDLPTHETPEFSDEMEHVVVNPRWNVPRSITVKEYLPRLQKNRNAVAHLDVVDSRGRVVSRDSVDFGRYTAANFPYRMRQKPSDDNALGEVKFIFPNPWNIYLHDTPSKGLFNETRRAFSHGCIRVGRPVELAHELLKGSYADPTASYARARASGNETFLALKPTLPVHLVYLTTFADEDGTIRHAPDVYGRDAAVWAALQKAGVGKSAPADATPSGTGGVETAALTE